MANPIQTVITPPGPAGAAHMKVVIAGVTSLVEAICQMNLVFWAVQTDRVDMCLDHETNVLTMQAFVHP